MAMNQWADMAIIAARGNSKAYRNAFALTGRDYSNTRTQGAALLALGYVLHWAFSPPLLNPKLEYIRGRGRLFSSLIRHPSLCQPFISAKC